MNMRLLLSLLALLFLPLCGCDNTAAEKEQIEAVYAELDRCNNAKDGSRVLEVFTESSFKRNEQLLKLGLDGTPEQVKALPPNDKLEVLRMRLLATRAELAKLDGRGYTKFATTKGWYVVPKEERTHDRLTKFTFTSGGNDAHAQLVSDGFRTGILLHFAKEGGVWRYDEPHAMGEFDDAFRREASAQRISIDKLIFSTLEEETGKDIPNSIWQPMMDEADSLFAPPPK